jgi:hypothetical protein
MLKLYRDHYIYIIIKFIIQKIITMDNLKNFRLVTSPAATTNSPNFNT